MNATLLSAIQTEPWSLVLLGATLFALASMARRKSPVSIAKTSTTPIVVNGVGAGAILTNTPVVEHAGFLARHGLRGMLGTRMKTAA